MKLTRNQIAYLSVLGASVLAFAVDRIFLSSPQSAAAESAAAATTPAAEALPAAPARPAPVAAVPPRRIAARFAEIAESRGLRPEAVTDPFTAPRHWLPEDARPAAVVTDVAENTKRDRGRRFAEKHRLKGIMVMRAVRYANVDGRNMREGEELDGFRVVEVRERSVVFERDGVTAELHLPGSSK